MRFRSSISDLQAVASSVSLLWEIAAAPSNDMFDKRTPLSSVSIGRIFVNTAFATTEANEPGVGVPAAAIGTVWYSAGFGFSGRLALRMQFTYGIVTNPPVLVVYFNRYDDACDCMPTGHVAQPGLPMLPTFKFTDTS
jgi:hypothetical protein